MKLFKLLLIVLFIPKIYITNCEGNVDLINGIIKFIKHINVHSVWTTTCWDISKIFKG